MDDMKQKPDAGGNTHSGCDDATMRRCAQEAERRMQQIMQDQANRHGKGGGLDDAPKPY